MVEQMRTPMALAFQMMGKLAETLGRAKWQLQVMFWLLQTLLYISCVLCPCWLSCLSHFVANGWVFRPMLRKTGHDAPGVATQEER